MCYIRRALTHHHPVLSQGFTGAVPFIGRRPAEAMLLIMKSERPPRPIHPNFTEELWTLMQHCWHQEPHSRPEVSEVCRVLRDS